LSNCDLERFPRQCAITQQQYPRPECKDCKAGQENVAKAATPVPRGNETIRTKKEEVKEVDQDTAKNSILRVLGRRGNSSISVLKNFAARGASKEEFQTAINDLVREGKISTKKGAREGSLTAWLSGTPEPKAKKKADGDPRPTAPRKPRAKPLSETGKDGGGNNYFGPGHPIYDAALQDLELRQQQIGHAIAALKALG
jgi:hypothetical protein